MSVISRLFGAAVVTLSGMLSPVAIPSAAAVPCADVEVVSARGTFEPPGVGVTGQAFVDALSAKLGGKSVDVYPVDYPASLDFATAADGVIDASNKVRDVAASCPHTKMALFGKPSSGFLQTIYTGAPPITVGHLYSAKTTDMCIPDDPICSPGGNDNAAHTLYAENGMAAQAADFAAHRLSSSGAAA